MINPLKSEEDAFRFTLIVVALLAPVVIVAIAFNTGVALGVAGGLALGHRRDRCAGSWPWRHPAGGPVWVEYLSRGIRACRPGA